MSNKKNYDDYRERKRKKGICIYGGCWEKALETLQCPKHRETARLYQLTRQKQPRPLKLLKPCVVCGNPTRMPAYCSPACVGLHRRRLVNLTCAWCGIIFPRRALYLHRNDRIKKVPGIYYCCPVHRGKGVQRNLHRDKAISSLAKGGTCLISLCFPLFA